MNGKRTIGILTAILLVFSAVWGAALAENGGDTWSVFLYLCGSDLESEDGAATANIGELLWATPSDKVNFVFETGGSKAWTLDGVDTDRLQRWAVTEDGYTLADEQPLASMGAAQTLGDFLSWGVANYPADKYMVLLWNHGGGSVGGVEADELFDYDSLDLTELAQGLSMAGVRFEVIGFDTCLMATMETAAAIDDYGAYMVASEETEPGGGWDYYTWGQYLCEHPEGTGLELGKVICDSYMAKCAASDDDAMATLSVTDLARVADLLEKFDAMAAQMTGVTGDMSSYKTLVQGVQRSENYGGNNKTEGYTNMVDLGNLIINTENVLGDTAYAALDSLFEAVLYNVKGESRSEANGLSVFYPLSQEKELLTAFASTAVTSGNYLRYVETVTNWASPEAAVENEPAADSGAETVQPLQEEDYEVGLETRITDDGYFALNVTDGMDSVASVTFSIYYIDEEYGEYVLLGTDNNLYGDWDSGSFEDNFNGTWPTLNGCYCEPTLLAETDEYNLYTIPILLNGEETNLRAAYVWQGDEDGHFEVYGAWNGIDSESGMSARDIVKLKDGDEVTLLFDAVDWETGETYTYEMDSFTVDGDVVMEDSELFDGEYLYQYIVTDVFGRETYSDSVIMEYSDGEISVYESE